MVKDLEVFNIPNIIKVNSWSTLPTKKDLARQRVISEDQGKFVGSSKVGKIEIPKDVVLYGNSFILSL